MQTSRRRYAKTERDHQLPHEMPCLTNY